MMVSYWIDWIYQRWAFILVETLALFAHLRAFSGIHWNCSFKKRKHSKLDSIDETSKDSDSDQRADQKNEYNSNRRQIATTHMNNSNCKNFIDVSLNNMSTRLQLNLAADAYVISSKRSNQLNIEYSLSL